MSDRLTREEFLALGDEDRMRARLLILQEHLADQAGGMPLSLRRTRPSGDAPAREDRKFGLESMIRRVTGQDRETDEAARKAGITPEAGRRFLDELAKRSAG